MAEPVPVESIGIRIFYAADDVASGATTEVFGIRDVTPPTTGKVENKEVTTHNGAATTKRKQYGPGLIEPADWSFKFLYTAAVYNTLQALVRAKRGWKVVFSDGGTYLSQSYISEIKIDPPQDGYVEAEVSLYNYGTESFSTSS